LKEEALDRTMWRNRFGRGFGPVVWQITDDDEYRQCAYNITVRSVHTTIVGGGKEISITYSECVFVA